MSGVLWKPIKWWVHHSVIMYANRRLSQRARLWTNWTESKEHTKPSARIGLAFCETPISNIPTSSQCNSYRPISKAATCRKSRYKVRRHVSLVFGSLLFFSFIDLVALETVTKNASRGRAQPSSGRSGFTRHPPHRFSSKRGSEPHHESKLFHSVSGSPVHLHHAKKEGSRNGQPT